MHDRIQGKEQPRSAETSLGRSLVEDGAGAGSQGRTARRKALGASLVIESALLLLLVVSPLLTSVAHPQLHISSPMVVVLGSWHAHVPGHPSLSEPARHTQGIETPVPRTVFPKPLMGNHEIAEPSSDQAPNSAGENILGANLMIDTIVLSPKVEPPHVDPPKTHETQTMKVSEGVQQAQLISQIEPRYPILGIQTRTEGTVRLRATISREGFITRLEVLSGHPLLVQAALDAVKQWWYHPTLLNGEAVEVETSITVTFRLSQ